jgi:flagellar basal body P-ring formation protein FlgA
MWRILPFLLAWPVWADSVVATRPIAAKSVISPEDITLVSMNIPGAAPQLADVLGQTATADIAAGRAILAHFLAATPRVDRNMVVPLIVQSGSMEIRTEGRTLSAGGVGDVIEVMNLSSRARITGRLQPDGSILVATTP